MSWTETIWNKRKNDPAWLASLLQIRHGTSYSYQKMDCKCNACRDWAADARARARARAREREYELER